MLSVKVQRLDRQYRLRDSQLGLRRRLDGLTETLVSEHLERALERRGIAPSDELCIRLLHVDLSYAAGASDRDCLRAWSERLAAAVELELERGDGARVVRYRSRVEAYLDIARALIAQRWQRSWAWHALGITGGEPSAVQIAREWHARLLDEPAIAVYMRALLAAGLLPDLLAHTPLVAADFEMVARTALAQAGRRVPGQTPAASRDESPLPHREQRSMSPTPDCRELVARIVRDGTTATALARYTRPTPALCVWPLIETEPVALRRPQSELDSILIAVTEASAQTPAAQTPASSANSAAPDTGAPTADATGPSPASQAQAAHDAGRAPASPSPPAVAPGATHRAPENTAQAPLPLRDDPPGRRAASPSPEPEAAIESDFGGLLMLINVTGHYDFVAALCRNSDRPAGWLLERMALALTDIPSDDMSLAVLCDRDPVAPSWTEREPAIDRRELRLVEEVVAGLVETLQALLPLTPPGEVVDWLCRRRARLELSPGWVRAVFDLDDVDAGIRRAGLDLNPDYVDWLGKIVRFDYE